MFDNRSPIGGVATIDRPVTTSVSVTSGNGPPGDLMVRIATLRVDVAAAQAELERLCLAFVDHRAAELDSALGPVSSRPPGARQSRQLAASELSVVLRKGSREVACLVARLRRVSSQLPTVYEAAGSGQLDPERVARIDRAARMIVHPDTLTRLDAEVVTQAASSTVSQLGVWLDRFLATCEPGELTERRRRTHADRRVTMFEAVNGMGYVTGEVSAVDAAAIDGRLTRLAWLCGAEDPRTLQQRRSDLFCDLLLGRTAPSTEGDALGGTGGENLPEGSSWMEVERIDPQTGELLGTDWRLVGADGELVSPNARPKFAGKCGGSSYGTAQRDGDPPAGLSKRRRRRRQTAADRLPRNGPQVTVGVVVSVEALIGASDTPAELWDRNGVVPAEVARELAGEPGTLFVRLLTDPEGHLLDVTELGRFPSDKLGFAVRARSGSCVFPTCDRPASLCDLDHHVPVPTGPTTAANLGPLCRPHHNAKTFAWLACRRAADQTVWTSEYAQSYRCTDLPLPRG